MNSAPDFWWDRNPRWIARLLGPAGRVYGGVAGRRMNRPGARLGIPVLCVGNLVAGGAGKTPTAIALAELLARDGEAPAFVSRGYGRVDRGADIRRVDLERDTAARVGDEPLLLARHAPTYVGADRFAAAARAMAEGATVTVLDDGLQNPRLAKTFAVAVVDGARGVGNGLCIPAGPLRAPLAAQWPSVSAMCVVGAGEAGAHANLLAREAGKPVWRAELKPGGQALDRLRGRRLFGFAGIGHPAKFFDTLTAHGLDLVATRPFPDHHAFTAAELTGLRDEARHVDAVLVTTEKDRARLPAGFPAEVLPVTLAFTDEAEVRAALRGAISPGAGVP